MHKIINKTRNCIFGAVILLGMGSANAALVDFTLLGNVESASAGNIFGVDVGSTITATGQIDDSLLAGGIYGSITNLQIFVGSQTFDDSMEAFGGSIIRLDASGTVGAGTDFDFTYEANENLLGAPADFDSFFSSFTGLNNSTQGKPTEYTIAGSWTSITVVPVPAAVWLFGSGLLALAGIARRKTA